MSSSYQRASLIATSNKPSGRKGNVFSDVVAGPGIGELPRCPAGVCAGTEQGHLLIDGLM